MFQAEMRVLLDEMKRRGPPPSGDHDIASQLYRAMAEHHEITEDRVLSEIGILFVEGFETTGEGVGRTREGDGVGGTGCRPCQWQDSGVAGCTLQAAGHGLLGAGCRLQGLRGAG
jgi:hypothetical protein